MSDKYLVVLQQISFIIYIRRNKGVIFSLHGPNLAGTNHQIIKTFYHLLDSRIILHGLSTALFETSLYIYFIEWTPTLQRAHSLTISDPLPFGIIFACYKVKLLCTFEKQTFLI